MLVKVSDEGLKRTEVPELSVDYAEYGGAPLLGINGTGIISHGKSNEVAIKNAILVAVNMVRNGVKESIVEALEGNTGVELEQA